MEAIFTGVFPDSIPIFSYLLEHVNMQAVFVLKKNTSNAVVKRLEESKTTEAYYPYEGSGQLSVTIDEFGSVSIITNNGEIIKIKLEELTLAI